MLVYEAHSKLNSLATYEGTRGENQEKEMPALISH